MHQYLSIVRLISSFRKIIFNLFLLINVLITSSIVCAQVKVEPLGALRFRAQKFPASTTLGPSSEVTDAIEWRVRLGVEIQLPYAFILHTEEQYIRKSNSKDSPIESLAYPLQNFIAWQPARFIGFKAGRQQLSFGSERVIGVSDWNYRSRVFDGGRLDLSHKAHLLTAFQMDVNNDSGGAKPFGGSHKFYGAYLALKTLIFDEFDLYYLNNINLQHVTPLNIKTAGVRLRHSTESFFMEIEGTQQTGIAKGLELKESQSDFELGYFFNSDTKRKISVGHLVASPNYFQLFPSGHSFLGAMDYFSRRSIRDTYLKTALVFSDRLKFELEWNHYQRLDKTSAPFDFSGAKKITAGSGNADNLSIGDEINLIITKEVMSHILYLPTISFYSLGLGYFKPSDYFEKTAIQPKGDLAMIWLMMDHRF